jgi:group I intron endonuclease
MNYYIVYETTNNINGKKYRGIHVTNDLNDDYLGSGKLLKKAIKKYGSENFNKIILEICSSSEEMYEKESFYVNEEWVLSAETYNLKVGGEGGWDYINKNPNKTRWTEEKRKKHSELMKEKVAKGEFRPHKRITNGFLGKKHTLEARKKISENNGCKLNIDEISERIEQWNSIPDSWGKIQKIAKIWNVSHTQVRRFLIKHNLI